MLETDRQSTASLRSSPIEIAKQHSGKTTFILGMGALSGLPNLQHSWEAFLTAAAKQIGYSSLSAMTLLSLYNYLEKRAKTMPQELIPVLVPTLTTILLNYGLHNLKGTEEPFLSTLPTAISASLGFPIWHIRTRILQLWKEIEEVRIDFSDLDT